MKINIFALGNIKEKYIRDGINEYTKRINSYCNINIYELKECSIEEKAVDFESDLIISKINKNCFNILLDIGGKELDSIELSRFINDKMTYGGRDINFFIGGSFGVNKSVRESVDFRISFSKFTFPHQLMRLFLVEQIYRSFKIIKNEKYHK